MHPFPTWETQFENANKTLSCARGGGGAQASQGLDEGPLPPRVHKTTHENNRVFKFRKFLTCGT